jgi:hypothetical protein
MLFYLSLYSKNTGKSSENIAKRNPPKNALNGGFQCNRTWGYFGKYEKEYKGIYV